MNLLEAKLESCAFNFKFINFPIDLDTVAGQELDFERETES